MPRLSKEERAKLEQQLADDDAAEDYDPDVTVSHADGSSERLPYSLARKHHPDRFKDPDPPKEEPKDEGAKGDVKRFQSGRRVS